jgi:hypothetical protein
MPPEFLYISRAYQHTGISAKYTNRNGNSQVAAATNGIFLCCNCDIDDASLVQFGYASGREHTFIIHDIVATYLPYMTDV